MSTLYVSDMDGTLLGTDSRVSPESSAILRDLIGRGVLFTVATARTPATVVPLMAACRPSLPAIVMTGAARWHFDTATYSHVHFIPADTVRLINSQCYLHGVSPFVYTLPAEPGAIMQVYHSAPELNHIEDSFYQERRNLELKHFNLSTAMPERLGDRVLLYFAMGPIVPIFKAGEAIAAATGCSVSFYPDIYNDNLGLLEIFAPGVSKASAIESLRRDVAADRLTVFGDNLNDLSMLAIADCPVAVSNALPEVREAAKVIIGANSTDSVARYIAADI